MDKQQIKFRNLADAIGVSRETISRKMNGKAEFTLLEAFRIADQFFPGLDVRYLFQRTRRR